MPVAGPSGERKDMSELDEIHARWAGRQWAPYGKQVVASPCSIDCPADYTSARILAQTNDPAISHVISQAPADVAHLSGEIERLRTALEQIANGSPLSISTQSDRYYRDIARTVLATPEPDNAVPAELSQIVDAGDH